MRRLAFLWAIAAASSLAGCGPETAPLPPRERALAALAAEDGFGAELELRGLLDAGTPRRDVAAFMGEAELLQGNATEAHRWLDPRDFSAETSARGLHMLGRLLLQEGDNSGASEAFAASLQRDPDNPGLWVDIGRLRYRTGRQMDAIEAARRAIALDPANSEALLFRGQIARDTKGLRAASGWFARAYRARPTDPDILAEYAATLTEAGRATDALRIIRELAALRPGDPRANIVQAVIAARGGDFDLAQSLLDRTGDLPDDMPAALLAGGLIDLAVSNNASAAQAFDRLYRMQPDNREARELLAHALALSGGHLELTHRFGDAALAPDASPYLMTVVARSWEALGERGKAAVLLDRAAARRGAWLVPLQPGEGSGASGGPQARIRALIVTEKPQEARRAADAFFARFSGSGDALSLAGDAALAAGDPKRAEQLYRKSAAIREPWPLARRRYAALVRAGRPDDAERLLERFALARPGVLEPVVWLAQRAFARGDLPQADRMIRRALYLGAQRDPEVLALAVATAARRGDREAARRFAARALAIQPANPVARSAMAAVSDASVRKALAARERAARR